MKKILIIAILISISFSNVVRAKEASTWASEVPVWMAKEAYAMRYMGVHPDNAYAIILEYTMDKLSKEQVIHALNNRIEIMQDKFVGDSRASQYLRSERLVFLDMWKTLKKAFDGLGENEKEFKAEAEQLASNYFINSYGEMQQLEKRRQALEEAVKKMQQDKGGK